MAVNPNSEIEVTTFGWLPDFARGLVRDLRVRWALEEAGLDYRVRTIGSPRPADYLKEQPFDQVPCFRDGTLQMFESGAIVQYIGEQYEPLLPRDPLGRYRAIQWSYAALNSVEPALLGLVGIDIFYQKEEWARLRRAGAEEFVRVKLKRVSEWLGERDWLEDRFTIGDLLMVTVLRLLRHTDIVAQYPSLAAYQQRAEARPAFQRALADQLALFDANQPKGETA